MPMDDRDFARFSTCRLFVDVDPRALRDSLRNSPPVLRSWNEGAIIVHAGTVCDSLIVFLQGEARAEMMNDEGKTFTVETLRPPEAAATAILFSPERILPVTLIATTPCRVAVLSRDALLGLCFSHQAILEAILEDIGARLSFLAGRLRAMQFATLRERIADWLLRRSQLTGSDEVRLDSSKERLAELFGVARPSLSRELSAMQKRGIIQVAGRTIVIADREGLKRLGTAREKDDT